MLLPLIALAAPLLAADTTRYVVDNHGRDAGEMVVASTTDSLVVRWVFTDRNRGSRIETRYRLGTGGALTAGELRSVLADGTSGPVTQRFETVGDSLRSQVGSLAPAMSAPPRGAFVGLLGATPWEQAALARHLLAMPDRSAPTIGGPVARAVVIADTVLRGAGSARARARLVMVYSGNSTNPNSIWLDERGQLLATGAGWFITVRRGSESYLPAMRTIEKRWRDARAIAVGYETVTRTNGTVVIRGGNLFDSETGQMRPAQTVVIRGDRVIQVGAADAVQVPAGATVIDATGKTVMPGLWDMHTHLQFNSASSLSLIQLANGLTTVRDLAADIDVATWQRDQERAGVLASPRIILAGFIEGPLAWAGPTASIARNEAEARALVARYDSLGYKQIKLYNVLHPDLVPVIAAEAKKRGMLLSGHIPRGMSIEAAVTLGFDEVQHAAFFFSNFFPDSLYLPRMRAYSQVATAVAPTFDVFGAPMTKLLEFVKAHGTAVDGTFNLWIGGGGAIVGAGGSTDQQRADSAYLNLIRRFHAMGIPLIAGTDNSAGTTFRRELEMYELAGIPASEVLQIATIRAARFMHDDKEYGSVSVGKVADLIIVNGQPAERIGDLQRIETVVRGGRVYEVSALQRALGIRMAAQPRP